MHGSFTRLFAVHWFQVGLAFLAGVMVAIILIPLNKKVTDSIGKMSVKLMHWKDQRIKVFEIFFLTSICHLGMFSILQNQSLVGSRNYGRDSSCQGFCLGTIF